MGKVRLKMGMHNRITLERFQAIKDDTDRGLAVQKIAKRHAVSESTVRKVRRSKNYHVYRIRADEQMRDRHPIKVVAPTSGLLFEDFGWEPIFFSRKTLMAKNNSKSKAKQRTPMDTERFPWFVVAIISLVVIAFIFALVMGTRL